MGLFGKIKNVLFEEEEIEIPVHKEEKKEEPKKEVKVEKKQEPVTIEKPVHKEEKKIENTFEFPISFDESEFDNSKSRVSRRSNVLDYEKEKKIIKKNDFKRYDEPKKEEKKVFTPSPVISPVYGVLDQNYKKEDIMPKKAEKDNAHKPEIDFDSIRKKAYGTLEDDINEAIDETKTEKLYEMEPNKTIDELLMDNISESEPEEEKESFVYEKPTRQSRTIKEIDEIEDELDSIAEEQSTHLDDTIESDLFNMIDSMYEKREDEEK